MPAGSGTPVIPQTMLDLGPAGWFRPEPENPPGNQLKVKAGFAYRGAYSVLDKYSTGDQTTAGFPSVASGAGFKRYDLVYLDAIGTAQIAGGTDVPLAAAPFTGAPGFSGGPQMPEPGVPVAYVLINEVGAVTIDIGDITQINGLTHVGREIEGYLVNKGALGAPPSGASDDVSALFAGNTPGGSPSIVGVITSPTYGNRTRITNQALDEIQHVVSGGEIYGRLTEAAGVWTLAYYYTDVAGVEQAVVDIQAESVIPPTDIVLVEVRRTYSRNDPSRPLFFTDRRVDQAVPALGLGALPLGGTTLWMNPAPAAPNPSPPSGFEFCDGTLVTTAGSSMAGLTKPDLMKTLAGGTQAFPRGADITAPYGVGVPFVAGGQDSVAAGGGTTGPGSAHSHDLGGHTHNVGSHTHSIPNHNHTLGSHTHSISASGTHRHGSHGPSGTNVEVYNGATSNGNIDYGGDHSHGGATGTASGNTGDWSGSTGSASGSTGGPSSGSGSESAHTHSIGVGPPVDNRPVFIEMAYIVRVL